jgi:fumarate hydratase subunit beta
MDDRKRICAPLSDSDVASLRAGDLVLISGDVIGARDAAHRRLFELLEQGRPLPVDLRGQIIYYVGPTPARPGEVIGTAGPTTAGRMDPYTPALLAVGLKGMIGKGSRSQAVQEAMQAHKAVYVAAVGGIGALLRRCVEGVRAIAYEDLGPEAMRLITLKDFPAIVVNDCHGGDLYAEARKRFARR